MTKYDTVKRLGDEICNDFLGFTPTSNSTKPPHIANGLFREVSGFEGNCEDVHEWMGVSERRKKPISCDDIISKYKNIFSKGENEALSNVKEFRFLLDDIFNPDNTVYPDYNYSVLNISSKWLVKNIVPSEAKIGSFISDILSKEINEKKSLAVKLINEALLTDTDDLTKIIKPIIAFPSDQTKIEKNSLDNIHVAETEWNACKEIIRQGFDNLAENMLYLGENKNSLLVLERMVNFSCFATFYYLINVNAVRQGAGLTPILIDAGKDTESIKKASEYCYSFAKTAVEDFFITSISTILHNEIPQDNKISCREWITNMVFSNDDRENKITDALNSLFESFCDNAESPIYALSHALQMVLYTFDYKHSSPSDFCRVLGVRGGLLGPRGNAAQIKRYLFNSFTLETITYSILSKDDIDVGIELKDFSSKLTRAYNILLGTDVDFEYSILERSNIAQRTPGDLRGDMAINAQRIADLYISLGMGHRYADGVTMIGGRG
ncbi:MAG: hypothetical protein E7273_13805 [Pseudobutyrivibrio ruminis]|uniref:hypothetical protein n=1 Tax=Succinivibrio dextrinosolvens TaxID=83771 RepID=UPI00241C27F7|nr:hypothetical protein [Succinivibrio dextrinosolvens]MBE5917900.1 hypothetical protein [Pseudobutyrivibrio ruminis]MBE6423424.1 hypothetical protein [Succinivibrio dextrinosolvens]